MTATVRSDASLAPLGVAHRRAAHDGTVAATSMSASAPAAAHAVERAAGRSTSHGSVTAGTDLPFTSEVTGSTTTPVASSASNVPTIWLPAVCEMPSVATSAATPSTVPSTVSAGAGGPGHDAGDGLVAAGRAATRAIAGAVGRDRRALERAHDRSSRPSTMPTQRVARSATRRIVGDHHERDAGARAARRTGRAPMPCSRSRGCRSARRTAAATARSSAPARWRRAGARRPRASGSAVDAGGRGRPARAPRAPVAHRRWRGRRLYSSASITFSSTVRCGSRWKLWNTKPIRLPRTAARAAVRQRRGVDAVEHVAPGGRTVEQAEHVEQRRLARPAGADDRDVVAARDTELEVAEHLDRRVAGERAAEAA